MESNDCGSIFVVWGMSIASKRAKERQNRSSDELVMDKTKISRSRYLQGSDVRETSDVRWTDVRKSSEIRDFGSVGWFRSSGEGRMSGVSGGSGRLVNVGRPVGRGQRGI